MMMAAVEVVEHLQSGGKPGEPRPMQPGPKHQHKTVLFLGLPPLHIV